MRRRRHFLSPGGVAACALVAASVAPGPAFAAPALATPKPSDLAPVTVIVTGDVLLGRGVTADLKSHHTNLVRWQPILQAADVAFCNLECALGPPGRSRKGVHLQLVAPVRALQALQGSGIDVISAANNHALDCGATGARQLLAECKRLGLAPLGLQAGRPPGTYPAFRQTIRSRRLVWLAASEWGPFAAGEARIRPLAGSGLLEQVKSLAAGGNLVLVSLHWGLEYQSEPTAGQRVTAHALIDAGAACIIGHHSHVTGPVEMYRGKPIFYSLGNFVFDAGTQQQSGMVARVTFGPQEIAVQSWPADTAPPLTAGHAPDGLGVNHTTTGIRAATSKSQRSTGSQPGPVPAGLLGPVVPAGETLRQSLDGHFLPGTLVTQRLLWTQDRSGLHHLRAYLWRDGAWHQIASGTHQEIDAIRLGDADGDGRDEIWLQLRQRSKLDIVPRPRLFLYHVDKHGRFRPRWRGSFLSRPFHTWVLVPQSNGRACDLAALETSADPEYAGYSWIDIYRWNGFGVVRVWEAPLRGKIGELNRDADQTGNFLRFVQCPPQGQPIPWQVRAAPPGASEPYVARRMIPQLRR